MSKQGNLRIAFYNVENLFSRPSIFNVRGLSDELLRAAAEVDRLLGLRNYWAQDSNGTPAQRIFDLFFRTNRIDGYGHLHADDGPVTLSQHADIRIDRGPRASFFDTDGPGGPPERVHPAFRGRRDWIGALEFRRSLMRAPGIEALADVIRAVDADILCVAEVENRRTLADFCNEALEGLYPNTLVIDGNDRRGIDVGIVTKADFPLLAARSNVNAPWRRFDPEKHDPSERFVFDRDCLEVAVDVRGTPIHFLINHLKSKRGSETNTIASDPRRIDQSREVARILRSRYRDVAGWKPVVIAGDMNENPDRNGEFPHALEGMKTSMDPLLEMRGEGILNVHYERHPNVADRGTSWFDGKWTHIDHLFASEPVFERVVASGVERSGMYLKETGLPGGVDREGDAASDHALVWMDLNWP
jgi:endonuclease/exonuclease/phosphatase family metal-dependent hydrolase